MPTRNKPNVRSIFNYFYHRYNNCHQSNLNGFNFGSGQTPFAIGICWVHFNGYYSSFESTEMAIIPSEKLNCATQSCLHGMSKIFMLTVYRLYWQYIDYTKAYDMHSFFLNSTNFSSVRQDGPKSLFRTNYLWPKLGNEFEQKLITHCWQITFHNNYLLKPATTVT